MTPKFFDAITKMGKSVFQYPIGEYVLNSLSLYRKYMEELTKREK